MEGTACGHATALEKLGVGLVAGQGIVTSTFLMILYFATDISKELVGQPGLEGCEAYDHATVLADNDETPSCTLPPVAVLEMRVGDDITFATVLCIVHLNAFKYNLRDGQFSYDMTSLGG